MRNFILFILFLIITSILWVFSFPRGVDKDYFLTKEVLANSTPFNVRIDKEYLKSLVSAYE